MRYHWIGLKSVSLAGAHSRGSMAHQSTHRRRDGVARFIKAQQQKRQLVRSSGPRAAHTPTSSSAHTQTAGRGRRHRRRPTKDAAAPAGHARALARQRAPMRQHISIISIIIIIIIRINILINILIRINILINNRLGGGEPPTQLHSALLGTPTDSVAGSLLPSFIRLYWAHTDAGGRRRAWKLRVNDTR